MIPVFTLNGNSTKPVSTAVSTRILKSEEEEGKVGKFADKQTQEINIYYRLNSKSIELYSLPCSSGSWGCYKRIDTVQQTSLSN